MKVKFWGVRGSLPSSNQTTDAKELFLNLLKAFLDFGYKSVDQVDEFLTNMHPIDLQGYGGATTCVQIMDAEKFLIIDGGSGIKNLSDHLEKSKTTPEEIHILMTHFHSDHIIGLPFFTPHFIVGKKIKYYSVQPECEKIVRDLFQRPIFPVGYEDLQSSIEFIHVNPYEKIKINGFDVTPYKLDHPDPCFGYRVEKNGKSYGHAVDTEAFRTTEDALGPDVGLYKNLDFLYIDSQYSEEEMSFKKGWGHGTFERAFDLCARFGVKQVHLAHFDPSASFTDIQASKARADKVYKTKFKNSAFNWNYAYEGEEVEF